MHTDCTSTFNRTLRQLLIAVGPLFAFVGSSLAADPPNIIVFYTDDHGHADLSCQGVFKDIKTPHVDALAKNGVLARHGYSTAPQCVPSRAGLLVGKFQSRFGVEANKHPLDGFDRELTIAERLQDAGYVTAQFGKWHLGPGPQITDHGFRHVYAQNANRSFHANITLDGKDIPMGVVAPKAYHIDGCSRAAASVIKRYSGQPFFLYIAYRAPHVPLDATPKYLKRFPGDMPERRRKALAMLSAVDDGVGLITRTLEEQGLTKKTLIFYIGDNGAPLKIHKLDAPGKGAGWDGSLNDPLNGEKGMLSEGGMHVPFVIAWPGTIPAGQIYQHPVSALDVAATASAIAKIATKPGDLDGTNLVPHLTGKTKAPPHDVLTWRWVGQSAIREGNWKLLRGGEREYLYDLGTDLEEKKNLAAKHPEIATRLRKKLSAWAEELDPPGLTAGGMSRAASSYFDFYLDGKPAPPLPPTATSTESSIPNAPWVLRNSSGKQTKAGLQIIPNANGKRRSPFLARAGLSMTGPVSVQAVVKTASRGKISFAWRNTADKDFDTANRISVDLKKSDDWQTIAAKLPTEPRLIHLRIHVPNGVTTFKSIEVKAANGKSVTLTE